MAWRLARERGLGSWSLRDLADAAGMRAPSLYVYFDGKNALFDAMFADGYWAFLARIDATPVERDPHAMIRRAAHVFFDFCVEDPARFQLLFLRTIPGFAPSEASYGLAREALDRLVEVLREADVTDRRAVDLWTAVLTGLATQQISNDPGGDRWGRLLDEAVDRFLAGTTPSRGRGRGGGGGTR